MAGDGDDPAIALPFIAVVVSIISALVMFVLTSQIALFFAGRRNQSENARTQAQNTRMHPRRRRYILTISAAILLVLMPFYWGIQGLYGLDLMILLMGLLLAGILSLFFMHGKSRLPIRSARTFSHYAIFVYVTFALALAVFHRYSKLLSEMIENPATSSQDLKALSGNFFVKQNYLLLGCIARSENTPPEILEALSRHHDSRIPLTIVHNAKTPCHVLKRFAEGNRKGLKDFARENYNRNCK